MSLRARFECECCLMVVTPHRETARWATEPIATGPCGAFVPMVVGPDGIPVVADEELARRFPELAVLSVMAHGQGDVETAVTVAQVAAAVALELDSDKQALYLDLIEAALGEAARKAFEMLPANYEFQGPSYRRGRGEGLAEGEAKSVLAVLEARGITVSEAQRARILECEDLERLDVWVRKAVTVTVASELFES